MCCALIRGCDRLDCSFVLVVFAIVLSLPLTLLADMVEISAFSYKIVF